MNDVETMATSRTSARSTGQERSGRVTSRDGTGIAYSRVGRGPILVVVDGALCSRSFGPATKLAAALADHFTVFTYDRRGRGDSGDAGLYAAEREVEDLDAILRHAGGSAYVVGISSGAVIALSGAAQGLSIEKLALYEAPFIVDASRPTTEGDWRKIDAAVAAGRAGEAARVFLTMVGVPPIAVALMRWVPFWKRIEASAKTLPRDGALVHEYQRGEPLPAGRWAGVAIPALVLDGSKSPRWMHRGMDALAGALPDGRRRTLEGQTHDLKPNVMAPVLREFFAAPQRDGPVSGA